MSISVQIGERAIGPGHPCWVIAEAGVNHNGRLDLAMDLVAAAAEAGADAVKFQIFSAKRLARDSAPVADYQKEHKKELVSQSDLLKSLELSREDFAALARESERRGIVFLASPFDEESLAFLVDLGVPALKLASGEIDNAFLLKAASQTGLPLILSSGTCGIAEVDAALEVLGAEQREKTILLHCVSSYPMPLEQANLRVVPNLRETFNLPTGWSDHSDGTVIPVAAVALGASVIEKHLTLDREMKGPDHKSSIEPSDFARMISEIRAVEAALGDGIKRPQPCETNVARVARRSLVAAEDLTEGTVLSEGHITALRPADGISSMRIADVYNRSLLRSLKQGDPIQWTDLS